MAISNACARFAICLLLLTTGIEAALPEPPRQHAAWTPASAPGIPEFVIKVAATLFDAGLADPRDGEYREAELPVHAWGKETLATHAWVFPAGYAVCWNGLVYRVRSVGARADLEADVRAIVAAGPWSGRMGFPFRRKTGRREPGFWFDLESNETIAPASIALLLRLGKPDLATMLWEAPEESLNSGMAPSRESEEGLWLATAATAWFASAYLRLVGAFERADDREAADIGESILDWRSRAPTSWRARNNWSPKRIPDISFLEPVEALVADSRRRLREPARSSVDLRAVVKDTAGTSEFLRRPRPVRIADLIDRLEDVQGDKIAFPGPLIFSFHPVCVLLIKEGEAAVDALLDAWENDGRMTRTFDYSRPWSIEYVPIPVHTVVGTLLNDIAPEVYGSTPAELRRSWQELKRSNRAERNFKILADDHAGPERWLESATFLTTRSDVEWADGNTRSRPGACDPKKPAPEMYGEALRTRQGPSIAELLAKRTNALVASNSELACRMAVKAVLWDAKVALPVAQAAATLPSCRTNTLLAAARLSLGDAAGAVDWAADIRAHAGSPAFMVHELAPLWMFPEDPLLRQTAEWLFARPESPLSPRLAYQHVHSPLLSIPSYRRAVAAALADEKVMGTATRSAEGRLSYHVESGGGGGSIEPSNDPRNVPAGQQRPIRVKDLVASQLSSIEGAPTFELDWTDSDKDAIISQIADFLRVHESELRVFPRQLQDTNCPGQQLYLDR